MLYQIYEAQRSLLEPFADMADAASKLYGNRHTLLGQMPMAQRVSAAYALFYRLGKDYEKPEFGIRKVDVDGFDIRSGNTRASADPLRATRCLYPRICCGHCLCITL